MNDAFITYRRFDGEIIARRLRRRLLDYRLPKSLREKLPLRPLTIYLDRLYERATNDFFEETIVPALRDSKHLIVVQTPAALLSRSDGERNWVVREIETFRELPQRNKISVALAAGSIDDPLPANLHQTLPNIERVDIRRLGPLGFGARDQVLTFIAALHNVPPELMPELRREEAKRRAAVAWVIATSALAALAVLGLLLGWALASRAEALRAQKVAQHELATSHFRAAARRDSPSEALAHAAKAVSLDPEYEAARALLIDLLMDRTWPLPLLDLSHSSGILEVAFSPDDSLLATRTDREIQIWNASDGRPLGPPMGMDAHIYEMSFSPDWRTLLVTTPDGWAAWDLASRKPLPIGERAGMPLTARYVGSDSILLEDLSKPPRLCDSATGRDCVVLPPIVGTTCGPSGIVIRDGRAAVMDLRTARTTGPLQVEGAIEQIAFNSDCQRIAIFASDPAKSGNHLLFVVQGDGSLVRRIQHEAEITDMELSRDGSRLLTIGRDDHVRVWSILSGERLADVAHPSHVEAAHFSNDASLVVTASTEGARLFNPENQDPASGTRYVPMLHSQEVTAAAFSHDGTKLLTGSADTMARLWDIRAGTAANLPLPYLGPSAIGFSADGHRMAVCDGYATALFDMATGHAIAPTFTHPQARLATFDRDLRYCLLTSNDNTASLRELPSGRRLGAVVTHGGSINDATFDESGNYAATAAEDGVRVWPIASPAQGRWLRSPVSDAAYSVRFLPASRTLTAGWRNGRLSVITPGGKAVHRKGSTGSVTKIHIADNGVDILLVDTAARLWSLRTLTPMGPLLLPNGKHTVSATDLSADGNLAATASDDKVFLWNARSGERLIDPLPHPATVAQVVFAPGDKRLVTAAADGVRLWDVASGIMLKHQPFSSFFTQAAISADGSRILVGSTDRTELFDVVNGSADDAPLLAAVAEAVNGFRINANGALEPVTQRADILQRVRASVASAQSADDSSAQFLRWFLADRASRQPSPFRTINDATLPAQHRE